jgi:hypothetical protein
VIQRFKIKCSLKEMLALNDDQFASKFLGVGSMLVPPTWPLELTAPMASNPLPFEGMYNSNTHPGSKVVIAATIRSQLSHQGIETTVIVFNQGDYQLTSFMSPPVISHAENACQGVGHMWLDWNIQHSAHRW